jgi:hypothetical protein
MMWDNVTQNAIVNENIVTRKFLAPRMKSMCIMVLHESSTPIMKGMYIGVQLHACMLLIVRITRWFVLYFINVLWFHNFVLV